MRYEFVPTPANVAANKQHTSPAGRDVDAGAIRHVEREIARLEAEKADGLQVLSRSAAQSERERLRTGDANRFNSQDEARLAGERVSAIEAKLAGLRAALAGLRDQTLTTIEDRVLSLEEA
jgi:hypothetical protein